MKRLAVLLLLLVATLAGCGVLSDMADLQARLKDAGYTGVSTEHGSVNGSDRLEVRVASSDPGHSTDQIAEIVWDSYPRHLDQVSVMLNATHEVYSEDDLSKAFGDRQVTEKPDDDADTTRTIVTWLIVGAVVFLLFLVGLIILIVFLVRRSRRTKMAQYPPPPGWPPAA